ncbi:NUDIX hydrolase domain-like protein [Lasiosphaeria miniovina]|uniref:NUDIX hydrolase domain-like protein n=1 Tax=Lasiosphaeria miniovina TaxID=1954250 RepID=A0AA39ZTQ0_9PEZI|nr:NUDIX hydrolase domain-like protein [Lasiosphaeria miniovina]KAK0703546.1 NUDIX hydrolase domain-like protein [Lasiosphaeria miniovina]
MDGIDASMEFRAADAFVMSCGTVTLDLALGKVLIVWNKKYEIFQLPKGRRNIDESMLDAAIRETYEETGHKVTPLCLNIATLATLPRDDKSKEYVSPKNKDVTDGYLSTDYLGGCVYPDPQAETDTLKAVLFFAAKGDSTATPVSGTQEAWEDLHARWMTIEDAASKLRFKGEVDAVRKAVENVRRSGVAFSG